MLVDPFQGAGDLCDDCPNLLYTDRHDRVVNDKRCSNTFVVLIQIGGAELHIDEDVRGVRKLTRPKDVNDMRMFAVA